MPNIFQSHPYSTRIGTLIERATDSGKLNIDWALVLEICDALNETDEGPREAIRAIRKLLTSCAGKDHVTVWYTIILIETCLKNCGRRFQAQVSNRDFLHDLIKVLLPKHNPPIQLQIKILHMLKTWVDADWDVAGRRELDKVYTALRRKGVQFPTSNEVKSLPPPTSMIVNRQPSASTRSISRSTRLASTFRRLTSSAVRGVDSRFKLQSPHHQHHNQNQSVDDESASCSPHCHSMVNQSYPRQLVAISSTSFPAGAMPRASYSVEAAAAVRRGTSATTRNAPPQGGCDETGGTQVLQVVTVSGYPVVTRNGQELFFAALPPPSRHHNNQQQHHHRQQHQGAVASRQQAEANNSFGDDQTLVDMEGTVRRLSFCQRERLSQDLAVVQTNLHILNDMLTELQPDAIRSDDLELLQELNETCRMMQQRVAEFLSQVADDGVTISLLQLNDDLNSTFQRYERFERYRLRAMRAQHVVATSANNSGSTQNQQQRTPPLLASTNTASALCGAESRRPALLPPPSTASPSRPSQTRLHRLPTIMPTGAAAAALPRQQQVLAITAGPRKLGGIDGRCSHDGDDYDDGGDESDDEELLDAIAEQTLRTPIGDSNERLVAVVDEPDNTLAALQGLRISDTHQHIGHCSFTNSQGILSADHLLERILDSVTSQQQQASVTAEVDNAPADAAALPGGPQREPLVPVPAPLPSSSSDLSAASKKRRTPSEVRRLEEALLIFDS